MPKFKKIDSMELPARCIASVKQSFKQVFHWQFTDYGPDHAAFSNQGLDGGFDHSNNIAATEQKIVAAGGFISTLIYSFQRGLRLHFCTPSGNEHGVWTNLGAYN